MTTSEFCGWVIKIPFIRFDHHSIVNQAMEEEQVRRERGRERGRKGEGRSEEKLCVCKRAKSAVV